FHTPSAGSVNLRKISWESLFSSSRRYSSVTSVPSKVKNRLYFCPCLREIGLVRSPEGEIRATVTTSGSLAQISAGHPATPSPPRTAAVKQSSFANNRG